jgi:hypothetical protein
VALSEEEAMPTMHGMLEWLVRWLPPKAFAPKALPPAHRLISSRSQHQKQKQQQQQQQPRQQPRH